MVLNNTRKDAMDIIAIDLPSLVKYALTYGFPVGTILSLIKIGINIGEFRKSFDNLSKSVNNLSPVVVRLNSCVQEIQSVLKNKYRTIRILQETIDYYSVANSPIVLKEEFKSFIENSGLNLQIKQKKTALVTWLKKRNPATGIDAQDLITDLVFSDEIEKYLDTAAFKNLLYESGKTTKDYYLILAIYLFEIMIPEVIGD